MRHRRDAAANLLALILGCLGAILVTEIVLRIHNPFYSTVRGDRIVLQANRSFEYKGAPQFGIDEEITYRSNSIGFQGPEPPDRGLRNILSVIAVGGSTTAEFVLNEEKSWTGRLASKLKDLEPTAWLNNAGMDGHTTFAHLQLLEEHVLPLEPSFVLFLVGLNDVGRKGPDQADRENYRGGVDFSSPKSVIKSLAAYSDAFALGINILRWARARRRGLPYRGISMESLDYVERESDEVIDRMLDKHRNQFVPGYRDRVSRLVESCLRAGSTPVLITQPVLYGTGFDPASGVDLSRVAVTGRNNPSGFAQWAVLELYNDATRLVARQRNVPLVDLARDLPKDSRLYYDLYHYDNAGAERVSEIVWTTLEPLAIEWLERASEPLSRDDPRAVAGDPAGTRSEGDDALDSRGR